MNGLRIGPKAWKTQRGMGLIELMIAMTVLAIGLGGTLAVILSAMASNNRNKLDAVSTMVAQTVMEQVLTQSAVGDQALPFTDCTGTSLTINTTGVTAVTGTGATLYTSGNAPSPALAGTIDFSQAGGSVPAGYRIAYVACSPDGTRTTYDVRWNIRRLNAFTKMVTVSARSMGASNRRDIKFFALPVTLRTIAGHQE